MAPVLGLSIYRGFVIFGHSCFVSGVFFWTDLNFAREEMYSCRKSAHRREGGPHAQEEGHGPRGEHEGRTATQKPANTSDF